MKVRIAGFVLLSFGFASSVQADVPFVDEAVVEACFASADGRASPICVGNAANACQAQLETIKTLDIVACNQLETQVWDQLMARELKTTHTFLEDTAAPDAPILEALDDAQAAWVAFRDAECLLSYTIYWDGSIRNIVASSCHMRMTAERSVALRDLRGEPQ